MREEPLVTGKIRNPNHSGSTFDSLLQEDGILEEVEAVAIQRVIAMRKKGSIDRSETFDEFLANDGLLSETEEAALKEIVADRKKARIKRVRET
jgi:hypothetical protein